MVNNKRNIKIGLSLPHSRLRLFAFSHVMLFIKQHLRFSKKIGYGSKNIWGWSNRRVRFTVLFIIAAILVSNIAGVISPFLVQHAYALGGAEKLLTEDEPAIAKQLKFDTSQQMFTFDSQSDSPTGPNLMSGTGAKAGVSATAYVDGSKGVSVTDSTNKVSFSMTPQYKLAPGQKSGGRIIYPLINNDGWLIYTMTSAGPKEDVVLNSSDKQNMELAYKMDLGDKLQARMEDNGSVGIYGNDLFSGDIATGSDKDAALVAKARKNAPKNKLLFAIPAPTIKESKKSGNVQAHYSLDGNMLTMHVQGLKAGNYPLTIDPSIYVVTAYQFMYGNNETNVNFDVANKLIKKGRTTGARFDSWQNTQNLPIGSWGSGSVASGGYIYQVGGSSFSGQVLSTQGSQIYTVPASGVSSITLKMWGAGGGGGSSGGSGGGAGYTTATIAVSGNDQFTAYIGGGGGAGSTSGGGGGAYTGFVKTGGTNQGTYLIAGGGGGGGQQGGATGNGGGGGNNGSNNGVDGSTGAAGGKGGTQSAGGAAGTGNCAGTAGASLSGGAGGYHSLGGLFCTTGSGGSGGTNSGGDGGAQGSVGFLGANAFGGGGGGGGYFGGGGGATNGGTTAGGGGGGSSYILSSGLVTAGSSSAGGTGTNTTPGNSTDPYRGNAGNGGAAGVAGSTGLIVISTNAAGANATATLNWAQFDTGNGTVTNANPGTGTCSGWCSNTAYNMPAARSNFSLVAYNGYLYAMGGNNASGPASANRQTSVYVAKLGANGEPRYWNPDSDDPTTWTIWHTSSSVLTTGAGNQGLINAGAVAYNNQMYYIGGLDSASNTPTSKVYVANILPNGKLGTWSTSTALTSGGPGGIYGMTALTYNDRIYIVGGATGYNVTPLATVYYINIKSDGTLESSWHQTSSFTTGRINMGGTNAVVWGGYVYVTGGCTATNASGYCTTIDGATQIASINTDGTLDAFTTVSGVTESRIGFGMLAWRDNIYVVGGCTSQDTTSGSCLGGIQAGIDYGAIPTEGEVSTVSNSVASGGGSCQAGSGNSSCNLPASRLHAMVAVVNNYIYVMGGCSTATCSTVTNTIYFAGLTSTGTIQEYPPNSATCPAGSSNSSGWCSTSFGLPGNNAGAAVAVWQGTIYLIGGISAAGTVANSIFISTITSTGVPGTWSNIVLTSSTSISAAMAYAYATARANPSSNASSPGNLYIIGGCTSVTGSTCNGSGNVLTTVYKCNIAVSGAVGTCSTTGQGQLASARAQAGGTTYGNYIYLIGGTNVTAEQSTIYEASFDSSNNISSWAADPNYSLGTAVRGASVFAYNGYLNIIGGINGNTLQNTVINAKINTNNGNIDTTAGFNTSAVTITAEFAGAGVSASGYSYIIGGCTTFAAGVCSAVGSSVQSFRLYNDVSGSPSSWAASTNTSGTDRFAHGAAVLNGYLYLAGGCTSGSGMSSVSPCGGMTANVEYTPIDNAGAIGSWTSGSALTTASGGAATAGGKLVAAGGSLYYIGGSTATSFSNYATNVYYATPNAGTGSTGTWTTTTGANSSLPFGRTLMGATVWNNRIYVVGGKSTASSTGCDANGACGSIFISPQLNSGGNITGWTTSGKSILGVNRYGVSAVAYANNLYILGGFANDGGGGASIYLSDVQYSPIDITNTSTDNLGTLAYAKSMPHGIAYADALAVNGYMYVFGGYKDALACSGSTQIAPISSNDTSGNPTGLGNWGEPGPFTSTNGTLTTGSDGLGASYYNGKVYLSGGECGGSFVKTASSTKNVQQATLLTQPQVAKYSISFDTDTDVYPDKYLVNQYSAGGTVISNGGAQWQLKYQTMSNPLSNLAGNGTGKDCSAALMSDWGQSTTVNPLVLSSLASYSALDASGTDMKCGRYYFMNFTVDAQTAYGFPEDFTRAPTITDITLRYTAQPAKRLMHGRTFVGGLQSPDDTPVYAH